MMVVGSHRLLASLRTDMACLAKNGGFLWQPHWSWYSALWAAHEMVIFSIGMWVSVPDLLWHSDM